MSEEKKGFFARLKEGLTKTRDNIVRGIDSVFSGFSAIDDDFYEELEEILIMGDIGVNATTAIVERLKQQVKEKHIKEPSECKQLLIESIKEQMQVDETAYNFEKEQSSLAAAATGPSAIVGSRPTPAVLPRPLVRVRREPKSRHLRCRRQWSARSIALTRRRTLPQAIP